MNDPQADVTQSLKEVIALLNKIERTYATQRSEAIGELQNKIWDDPKLQSDDLDFLQYLAGDLNFYEPVEQDRDTELGYYDDDKLLELTGAARKQAESILAPGAA